MGKTSLVSKSLAILVYEEHNSYLKAVNGLKLYMEK